METIHIRVSKDIRKQLRILSAETDKTMTQLMGEIISEYLGKIKGTV
nr:MAG TPA: hypothetical protein [Caudoviricetes sp.]